MKTNYSIIENITSEAITRLINQASQESLDNVASDLNEVLAARSVVDKMRDTSPVRFIRRAKFIHTYTFDFLLRTSATLINARYHPACISNVDSPKSHHKKR